MSGQPDVEGREIAELKGLLEADLATLFKLTFTYNRPVAEGDARVASVILRRWLCEGLIGRLCNKIGVAPTFPILDNSQVLDAISQQPTINYVLTGGIRFDGEPVMGIYNSTAPATLAPLIPVESFGQIEATTSRMMGQRRVYFEGDYFTCEDIIRFTANKLGGVHFDSSRNERALKMQRAAEFMTFGGPIDKIRGTPPGELYLDLEPNGREILSGFHIEIIAAATSFICLRLNGQQLLQFSIKPNLGKRILNRLGWKKTIRARLHELGTTGDR